ncbi:hypothetical protein ACFYYB_16250 [Streptomyces sp. NPDC002886]|uniref:hypothetical protein n=1 Tax=Streptomyces sp. NPDC002886 TaxID=3364667 RepID=UPI00367E5C14
MRSALHTSLACAALAGGLLLPAAGSSLAASAPASPCVSPVKRVDIGEGGVADLTMSPEGPKAFAHSADPSRTWSLTLTRTDPEGRDTRIVDPSGAHPRYEWSNPQGGVHTPLGSTSFPVLPQGCKPAYEITPHHG